MYWYTINLKRKNKEKNGSMVGFTWPNGNRIAIDLSDYITCVIWITCKKKFAHYSHTNKRPHPKMEAVSYPLNLDASRFVEVENRGLEPLTSTLPALRSPS
jgi:hypothetical protein